MRKSIFTWAAIVRPQMALAAALSTSVCFGVAATQSLHADEPQATYRWTFVAADDDESDEEGHTVTLAEVKDESEQSPKLWLGVALKEVEGDLAKYLGTEKGILIDSVYEDSPAEKAGVQEGDLLLRVGDEDLSTPSDLISVMMGVEEGDALDLVLLRKGKEVELEATPASRPDIEELEMDESINLHLEFTEDGLKDAEGSIRKTLEKLQLRNLDKDLSILRLGRGPTWRVVEGENAQSTGDLEMVVIKEIDGDKVQVKVNRKDDEPAKITVETEDGVKEYTEEEMGEMPEEISVIVTPLLKSGSSHRAIITMVPQLEEYVQAVSGDEKEMSKKLREAAEKYQALALEQAESARSQANRIRARVQRTVEGAGGEMQELRKLVDELRKEVADLRAELSDKK